MEQVDVARSECCAGSMSLVYFCEPETDQRVHVLIVGVGEYPHLEGGTAPAPHHVTGGMKQLQSPPKSARALADWFITRYHHTHAKLATVDLLLSDAESNGYTPPRTPAGTEPVPAQIDYASRQEIVNAAIAWKDRARADANDMLVFYFCGHGLSNGFSFGLLARDFGEVTNRPWDGGFSFNRFLARMEKTAAARQVFFVDACRVANAGILDDATQADDLIGSAPPFHDGRKQAVYYSSQPGELSYGRPGECTLFTKALIEALDGGAADDSYTEDWKTDTGSLNRAISDLLADGPQLNGAPPQNPQVLLSPFELMRTVETPIVPLYVATTWHEGDDPPADVKRIEICKEGMMSSGGHAVVDWSNPWATTQSCAWHAPSRFGSKLIAGERYSFRITFQTGEMTEMKLKALRPPFGIREAKHV
jgi:hypothetical protein